MAECTEESIPDRSGLAAASVIAQETGGHTSNSDTQQPITTPVDINERGDTTLVTTVQPEDAQQKLLLDGISKHLESLPIDKLTQVQEFLHLQDVSRSTVKLEYDAKTQQYNVSEEKPKVLCTNPNLKANRIATPKEDTELNRMTQLVVDFILDVKEKGRPSGVLLNQLHVRPSSGRYRKGEEYEKTGKDLGKGNMAKGGIVVVKDKATGSENAMKTIMIADFRGDETKCWIDLNDTKMVPQLYTFYYDSADNTVKYHMEALGKQYVTLQDVIDNRMQHVWKSNPDLVKPFSLCMLYDVLTSIETMTSRNVTHGDLHGGNIMIDHNINRKVLDFDRARRYRVDGRVDKLGEDNFHADVVEGVRIFTGLFRGDTFENRQDMKKNWQERIEEWGLTEDERGEIFNLMEACLQIQSPSNIPGVKDNIQAMLHDQKRDEIMTEVAKLLFPEKKEELEATSTMDAATGELDFLTRLRRSMGIAGC